MTPPLPQEISCTTLQDLRAAGDDLLLVDCREAEEHALVALPDSTLLPMSQLAGRVQELAGNEQRRLVVYCHHGFRSQRVADWLRTQGFEQVQSLTGGIDHWATELDPTMVRY